MPHGVKIAGCATSLRPAFIPLVGHAIVVNPVDAKDPQTAQKSSGEYQMVFWNGEAANVGGGWMNQTRSTFCRQAMEAHNGSSTSTFWKKVGGNPVRFPLDLQCNGPIFDTPEQGYTRIDDLPYAPDIWSDHRPST